MIAAGTISNTQGAAGACIPIFIGFFAYAGRVADGNGPMRLTLALASISGLCCAFAAAVLDSGPLFYCAVVLLAVVVPLAVVVIVRDSEVVATGVGRGFSTRLRRRWSPLAFGIGLVFLVCSGVAVGALLGGRGNASPPASVIVEGNYRVSGTCVNGACTVNECREAAPCGLANSGRLYEGKPLDIVCQAVGAVAEAPNGRRSKIWDRLQSGLYVSDLFVGGTVTSRFTKGLSRCSGT